MQRIRERGVPVLRREALIPTAHLVVGDQRGDAHRRERFQVRLAVIARIGGDQRVRGAERVRGRHHGHE